MDFATYIGLPKEEMESIMRVSVCDSYKNSYKSIGNMLTGKLCPQSRKTDFLIKGPAAKPYK